MTDPNLDELEDLVTQLEQSTESISSLEPYRSLVEASIATLMDAIFREKDQARKMRLVAVEYKLRLQRKRLLEHQRN